MFNETRVWDAFGNLKKIISSQELHARHWKVFQKSEENLTFYPKKNSATPERKKAKIDEGSLVDRY